MLLYDKLKDKKLILASRSPRRRQLLSDCGLDYTLAEDYDVEEVYPTTMQADEVPVYLSQLKSNAYPLALAEGEIVITADTVVVIDEKIIGKPSSREDAIETLQRLSGRMHKVITGVTLRDRERSFSFSAVSNVYFRKLSCEEIEYYVDNFRPYDKAGAYGIQEWIGYIGIERIEGSFFNVMGLPIQKLYTVLNNFVQ